MLISELTHTVLFYLAVSVLVLGIAGMFVAPIFDEYLIIVRVVAAVFILLGAGGGFVLIERSAKVVVVRGSPPTQQADREYQVFSATISTPGGDVTIEPDKQKSWVVNASTAPIEVVTVVYTAMPVDELPAPITLAPGQKHQVYQRRIPHLGPSERPPESVMSPNPGDSRVWVTWGPRR